MFQGVPLFRETFSQTLHCNGYQFICLADSGLGLIDERGLNVTPVIAKILHHIVRKESSRGGFLRPPVGLFRRLLDIFAPSFS